MPETARPESSNLENPNSENTNSQLSNSEVNNTDTTNTGASSDQSLAGDFNAIDINLGGVDPRAIMGSLESWFTNETGLSSYWYWALETFVLVLLIVTINYFIRRVLNYLENKVKDTNNLWDDAFYYAARRPLPILMWVLGIGFVLASAGYRLEQDLAALIEPAVLSGVIITVSMFFTRLVTAVEHNMVSQSKAKDGVSIDKTTANAVGKLVRVAIIITTGLILLESLGISVSALLAFGGVGGIAIGFAAKDLLANFFGGLVVYLDRPFAVGDWISSPEKQIEGTVEKIGWRTTCVRKFDKRPLYIPNQVFTTAVIENPSRMTNRRIYETIGVRYSDNDVVAKIAKEIKEMLQNHPEIDTTQTLMVNFDKFNASSVDFFVYTFTKTTVWTHYHEVKQNILLRISEIIDANNAEIAFPTQTLHMYQETKQPSADANSDAKNDDDTQTNKLKSTEKTTNSNNKS